MHAGALQPTVVIPISNGVGRLGSGGAGAWRALVLSRRDYRGGRLITTTADRILPAAEPQEPDLRAGS